MEDKNLLLKNLIGKDEKVAQLAADFLVDNSDVQLYKMLIEKSDFLFDFVKKNVCKRIDKAVNKENYLNLLNLFSAYSPDYDDLLAAILAKHANQDLTDEMFEFLENGTLDQKTYAAKYFSYIPDTVSIELLAKYSFSDDENLSFNSAEALGQMQDDVSYDVALASLSSDDDFERLKAVKFFVAYGRNYPIDLIIKSLKTSKIPENIAGQIPYMISLCKLLEKDTCSALIVIDNILSGLGEILPLSDIFQFEFYEVFSRLIEKNRDKNQLSGEISEILLKALSKMRLFMENQEYIFDESKETKYEITSILNLLQAQNNDFWSKQKEFILEELKSYKDDIHSVFPLLVEFNIKESIPMLRELLGCDDEIVICEVLEALSQLGVLTIDDINCVKEKIKNENIKAIINNLKA